MSSFDHISNVITSDFTWRIREISTLRGLVDVASGAQSRVLSRSAITILYAHWEGFVRTAATQYLKHICTRSLEFATISAPLLFLANADRINKIRKGDARLSEQIALCEGIRNMTSGKGRLKLKSEVFYEQTNLNSKRFSDICTLLSIDYHIFESEFHFIDRIILERRNFVAHGENLEIKGEELRDVSTRLIALLRQFKNEIENNAIMQRYKGN